MYEVLDNDDSTGNAVSVGTFQWIGGDMTKGTVQITDANGNPVHQMITPAMYAAGQYPGGTPTPTTSTSTTSKPAATTPTQSKPTPSSSQSQSSQSTQSQPITQSTPVAKTPEPSIATTKPDLQSPDKTDAELTKETDNEDVKVMNVQDAATEDITETQKLKWWQHWYLMGILLGIVGVFGVAFIVRQKHKSINAE